MSLPRILALARLVSAGTLLSAACSPAAQTCTPQCELVDGGDPVDGGPADAGSPVDAGVDAGSTVDAGVDAGVASPTNPLGFTVSIVPDPPRLGSNTMSVFLRGANGVPVPGAVLTAKTFMPSMGHGSATPTVVEVGAGVYTVNGVSFTMFGTWTVTLTAAKGPLSGTQTFTYSVK